MTNGVLLFAHNNQKMDYVKQAIYCARKIKKYLSWRPKVKIEDSIKSTLKFIRYI